MTDQATLNAHPISQTGSQEGLIVGPAGHQPSDREFHERAMLTDLPAEQQDLDAIAQLEPDLAERQVKRLAQAMPARAKEFFQALIRFYPHHPRRPEWERAY